MSLCVFSCKATCCRFSRSISRTIKIGVWRVAGHKKCPGKLQEGLEPEANAHPMLSKCFRLHVAELVSRTVWVYIQVNTVDHQIPSRLKTIQAGVHWQGKLYLCRSWHSDDHLSTVEVSIFSKRKPSSEELHSHLHLSVCGWCRHQRNLNCPQYVVWRLPPWRSLAQNDGSTDKTDTSRK